MTDKDIMLAYLENRRLEETADYLRRGRHLEGVANEELNQRWVVLFRRWVRSVGTSRRFDHQPRKDIESEMQLHGVEPPWALVQDELGAMEKASRAFTDALARDPVKLMQTERQIGEDLEAFQRSLRETKPN
jgi:hypothetical protein